MVTDMEKQRADARQRQCPRCSRSMADAGDVSVADKLIFKQASNDAPTHPSSQPHKAYSSILNPRSDSEPIPMDVNSCTGDAVDANAHGLPPTLSLGRDLDSASDVTEAPKLTRRLLSLPLRLPLLRGVPFATRMPRSPPVARAAAAAAAVVVVDGAVAPLQLPRIRPRPLPSPPRSRPLPP